MKTLSNYLAAIVCTLVLLSFSTESFGQQYELLPAEIQNQMDENKIQGKDLFSGIQSTFIVHTQGLEANEFETVIARASSKPNVVDLEFLENGVVKVNCDAVIKFDEIKSVFSELVTNISSVEANYSLKK